MVGYRTSNATQVRMESGEMTKLDGDEGGGSIYVYDRVYGQGGRGDDSWIAGLLPQGRGGELWRAVEEWRRGRKEGVMTARLRWPRV